MKSIKFSFMDRDISIVDNHLLLVIENRDVWSKIMSFLFSDYVNCSEVLEIYEDDKQLDVDDASYFISNCFYFDFNSKRNIQALYKKLKTQYFDFLKEKLSAINNVAEKVVEEISLDYDIELSMVSYIKEDDIFKLMNIQFSETDLSRTERFVRFICVINDLQKIDLFFVSHLKESFSEDELALIEKQLLYKKIHIIDFETVNCQQNDFEKKIIVDKDLCVN